jgi:predicted RNase H-like HicB family nuclease
MLKSGIWPKMAPRQMEEHTMVRPIVIHADWDPEAGVWVATTQDLRGMVTEAETMEALRAKLPGIILDLLEENGISDRFASIEIVGRASDQLIPAE